MTQHKFFLLLYTSNFNSYNKWSKLCILIAGVKGVQFEEIYSLEKELLEHLKPVHGLIFLFKWVQDLSGKPQGEVVKDSRVDEIFFPKQVKGYKS